MCVRVRGCASVQCVCARKWRSMPVKIPVALPERNFHNSRTFVISGGSGSVDLADANRS